MQESAAGSGRRQYRGRVITIQRTVTADQPVEKVYAYLSDFENAVEWDAGTVACRRLDGDGGVGTSYLNTSRFLGRDTQLTYVVKDLVVDERFVVVGSNKTVTSTDRIEINPRPGGAEVIYTATFEFSGVARWLEPLLRPPIGRLADNAEQSLTRTLAQL